MKLTDTEIFVKNAFPYLTANGFFLNNFYINEYYLIYTHPCGIPICLEWAVLKKIYSNAKLAIEKFFELCLNHKNPNIKAEVNISDEIKTEIESIFNYHYNNTLNDIKKDDWLKNNCLLTQYSNVNLTKNKRWCYIYEIFNHYGFYRYDNMTITFYINKQSDILYENSYILNLNKLTDPIETILTFCEYTWSTKNHIKLFMNSYRIYMREITYIDKLKWY